MTKFAIQEDHIRANKYIFSVSGLPPITFTSVGSLANELDVVDLPDRTQASGGRTKAGECEVKVPSHHVVEVAACDSWVDEAKDPVSPTYKKVGTMTFQSGTGLKVRTKTLIGCFLSKGELPEAEMNNEGEMVEDTYTLKWDDLL
jgi:hypothetical protein